jgi:hypothetical protein
MFTMEALVAFCSPVHGFNYPPVMQSFIRRFTNTITSVFICNLASGNALSTTLQMV